jgi:hypothetical protein
VSSSIAHSEVNALTTALIDERPAADFFGVSVKTLQQWRQRKTGPRYYKVGNRVKYDLNDLREYLNQHVVEPQNDAKPAA